MQLIEEIQRKAQSILALDKFLSTKTYNNITLHTGNDHCAVPGHLLDKWYKDLEDHRDAMVKELTDGTRTQD